MTESGSGPRELTAEEQRNVATAYEQMAAAMAGWRDATEGRKRLKAIQFGLQPIDGGLVVGEGPRPGFVHSFVVNFDDEVTSAIEFSSGILETHP